MPSQRPFPFASQNGSGGGPASPCQFPSTPTNGSGNANRPRFGKPAQLANCGANRASAAAAAAGCEARSGGVVARAPAPARKPAPQAGAAPIVHAAIATQHTAHASLRPPTAEHRSAGLAELRRVLARLCHTAAALGGGMRKLGGILTGLVALLACAAAQPALAAFPYSDGSSGSFGVFPPKLGPLPNRHWGGGRT